MAQMGQARSCYNWSLLIFALLKPFNRSFEKKRLWNYFCKSSLSISTHNHVVNMAEHNIQIKYCAKETAIGREHTKDQLRMAILKHKQ